MEHQGDIWGLAMLCLGLGVLSTRKRTELYTHDLCFLCSFRFGRFFFFKLVAGNTVALNGQPHC